MSFHASRVAATLVALLGCPLVMLAQGAAPQGAAQAPAGPPAEQVFKNIKAFNGKPADLLRPTMTYISTSLGVECSFCHDTADFSADTKQPKSTAREMIAMVYAINKDNFNNRSQVECYTCHQGHQQPRGNLAVATPETLAAMASAQDANGRGGPGGPGFGPGGPGRGPQAGAMTAQQLLDKYIAGLGGQSAVDAVKSATLTATRQEGATSTPETIAWKAGTFTDSTGGRDAGYDGKQYYSAGRGGRETSTPDVSAFQQLDAAFFPGLVLRDAAGARVQGPRDMNGHSTLSVSVRAASGVQTYLFDATSGLLYRYSTSLPTLLGTLPLQVDYSNYKAAGGVQIPYTVTFSTANRVWTRQVTDIKLNP